MNYDHNTILTDEDIRKISDYNFSALIYLISFSITENINNYTKVVDEYMKASFVVTEAIKRHDDTLLLMSRLLDSNQVSYKNN